MFIIWDKMHLFRVLNFHDARLSNTNIEIVQSPVIIEQSVFIDNLNDEAKLTK
jgi:hypothetical protein